ncbi:MAG TPA: hypothetical protein VEH04_15595 [Verrucomicrobiae bacterium]|nr:hypothetical protein [Verrucomicrobiae bacterium]
MTRRSLQRTAPPWDLNRFTFLIVQSSAPEVCRSPAAKNSQAHHFINHARQLLPCVTLIALVTFAGCTSKHSANPPSKTVHRLRGGDGMGVLSRYSSGQRKVRLRDELSRGNPAARMDELGVERTATLITDGDGGNLPFRNGN